MLPVGHVAAHGTTRLAEGAGLAISRTRRSDRIGACDRSLFAAAASDAFRFTAGLLRAAMKILAARARDISGALESRPYGFDSHRLLHSRVRFLIARNQPQQ
jgi:hypothetical protein